MDKAWENRSRDSLDDAPALVGEREPEPREHFLFAEGESGIGDEERPHGGR